MCHLGFAFCIPNSIDVNTFEHFCPVWKKKSSFYLFFWCFVVFFFHLANLRGDEGYWGAISDGSSLLTRNLLRCLANTWKGAAGSTGDSISFPSPRPQLSSSEHFFTEGGERQLSLLKHILLLPVGLHSSSCLLWMSPGSLSFTRWHLSGFVFLLSRAAWSWLTSQTNPALNCLYNSWEISFQPRSSGKIFPFLGGLMHLRCFRLQQLLAQSTWENLGSSQTWGWWSQERQDHEIFWNTMTWYHTSYISLCGSERGRQRSQAEVVARCCQMVSLTVLPFTSLLGVFPV